MKTANVSVLTIRFKAFGSTVRDHTVTPRYEFHIRKDIRDAYDVVDAPFSTGGNIIFADFYESRLFATKLNRKINPTTHPERVVKAGKLNAMALIDELLHAVCDMYRESVKSDAFSATLATVQDSIGVSATTTLLRAFVEAYPSSEVHDGTISAVAWLKTETDGVSNRLIALEELLLLRLANENPAFNPFSFLFDDAELRAAVPVEKVMSVLEAAFLAMPAFGPDNEDLPTMLRAPMRASPYSLAGQLDFIRRHWGLVIGHKMRKVLGGVDMLAEEDKPFFPGPGPTRVLSYDHLEREYERFSEDRDWMPRVVMIAKSTLVWLDQLSTAYGRQIRTLDAIPDEELDNLANRGFNSLWLIGLWERSQASRRIKELCGNPEAAASAYSLFDYEIANELGGWHALEELRKRAEWRGIRLAADMVPNHTGIDSAWVRERPDLFIQRDSMPFPTYSFSGENLSGDSRIGIWLEDHYYDRRDAAVVFKRVDFASNRTSYVYHGNDGTSMPWNDTAQIDFLKPEAREAVKERILHVAKNFPIIRFDAAMIMAKKHFRRLWYPEPGHGGDIASRGECALPNEEFSARMPEEFWREVVDMCAKDAPDTLLLAEAFWMMEGYFVRTLGMHRVYNSAFMNMLKNKENRKYRETIKNTQEFDKDILKRFVNFMNNPDEDTAVAQFGKDDHYFGVCTLMATLPGLPMFGHGQVEGYTEKYGMEYRRAYKDETPDSWLVERHEREIFPLLKKRYLFSGVDDFLLFDFVKADGQVDEDVFAYSNGSGGEKALVLFNNAWARTAGRISVSCPYVRKKPDGGKEQERRSLVQGLGLTGADGRFLVMREQRSGLWYLRCSQDVRNHGLFAMLEGFQCQVFLDIHEAADDKLGTWAALCERQDGRGVSDLTAALQDVALEGLYSGWSAVFGKEYFTAIQSAFKAHVTKKQSGAPKKSAAAMAVETGVLPDEQSLAAFARIAGLFMSDIAGASIAPAETESRVKTYASMASRSVSALAELAPEGRSAGVKVPGAQAVLAGRLRMIPGAVEAVACLTAFLSLPGLLEADAPYADARALVDRWCLDRKLRESMQAAGIHGDEAWRATSFAKAALGILDEALAASVIARSGRKTSAK
ncbi:MAG: alpha-amylase, partial [Spirochaetales bacterium]